MSETTLALQTLLDRLKAGDPRARSELIERANQRLAVIARRLLRSFPAVKVEEETAGIVNEAFPRLDRALAEIKPNDVRQFLGLASLKMRQTLLDMVRRMTGRGLEERPEVFRLGNAAGGMDRDPAAPAAGNEIFSKARALDVLDALEKLSTSQRELVELLYFQGLTQAEAGELLGVSEDTVKRRWAEARVALFSRLKSYRTDQSST
jgi:RNA polymerase sigma factor (TIGR02999 family)